MKIVFSNTFLHISAIGTLILALITDYWFWPFAFGMVLGTFIKQDRMRRNGEL
jgi:hypothetical protein